jgi:hypothetical protein
MTQLDKIKTIIADSKPDGISTKIKHDPELAAAVTEYTNQWDYGSWIERVFCYAHQLASLPRCACGNKVSFVSITKGYREFCARTCSHAREAAATRRVAALKESGGVGLANPASKLKAQQTLKQRHGVSNGFQLPQVVTKRIAHNPMKDPSVVEAIRQRCLEQHGVDWHSKRPDVLRKAAQSILDQHGVTNISQKNYSPETVEVLNDVEKLKTMFESSSVQEMAATLQVSETTVLKYLKVHGIRMPREWVPEVQLKAWLASQGFTDFHKTRTVLNNNRELDLHSPSQNIAIEHCGLYWHPEEREGNSYHKKKYLECKELGISLVTIFEDEWLNKREVVLARLRQKLGVNSRGIGARQLQVSEISRSESVEFLNQYHISGSAEASVKIGARNPAGELVAVMTFSKGRRYAKSKWEHEWEMIRFSTDGSHYPGVASRLFQHFVKHNQPKSVLSYADLRWGEGHYLEHLRFNRYPDTTPNYWYFSQTNPDFKRYHRYTFNKQRLLKKLPGADTRETEKDLARTLGLQRIYDCGNAVWIWRA